ncbi:MAG: hypothetical protein KIS88_06225 [Anaerolineales bacterium]|nr:hypothetical protein [Anaerolineales bacterium]
MLKQFLRAVIALVALLAAMVYPYLPGRFDSLAVPLSTLAQLFGVAGTLLLAPLGIAWLVYELRGGERPKSGVFALGALVAGSLLAIMLCVAAYALGGALLAIAVAAAALWLLKRLARLRQGTGGAPVAAPWYMALLPLALLAAQLVLAGPLTESSRARGIATSGEMLRDIEAYRAQNGSYPSHLAAVWQDYSPGVAGIPRYHYAVAGDGFNLFFEQPLFILDNFGAREFVVYNPLGQHSMISHDSWILLLSPSRVLATQGWFQVNDAGDGWRYFWFD